jgi:long-subunit acyl-CoA synthetase (AMP-forming)
VSPFYSLNDHLDKHFFGSCFSSSEYISSAVPKKRKENRVKLRWPSGGTAVVDVLVSSLTNICRFLLANGLPGSAILDAVVFRKVREATGGRMRLCMNGAAPIAKDTPEFLSLAIAPLINGYGSTETTAYALDLPTSPPSPSSLISK